MTAGRRAQKATNDIVPAREGAQRGKAQKKALNKAQNKAKAAIKASTNASGAHPSLKARLSALERERDALKSELQRTEALLRRVEKTQAQVSDRIAWALDSLHNILDGKG